jgi:hypothetical protein
MRMTERGRGGRKEGASASASPGVRQVRQVAAAAGDVHGVGHLLLRGGGQDVRGRRGPFRRAGGVRRRQRRRRRANLPHAHTYTAHMHTPRTCMHRTPTHPFNSLEEFDVANDAADARLPSTHAHTYTVQTCTPRMHAHAHTSHTHMPAFPTQVPRGAGQPNNAQIHISYHIISYHIISYCTSTRGRCII